MSRKGLIHIYTGNGKGKTTAALGLALRARGHDLKVAYVYFHKDPKRWDCGEHKSLKKLGVDVFGFAGKHPCFNKKLDLKKVREECQEGLKFVESIYKKNKYDLLILDEINISMRDGFLSKRELLNIMEKKPYRLELVLTGRGMIKDAAKKADLVSKIDNIKHPYDSGMPGRIGIEY
ncbi:MAG: cob(I)yrinic acid a,c-diamide adenosyltransferase [Candidatus Omnitrophica bacterium]|nr:cob(I)yrinic acid a,c-diamide adenosyltransferase [Candidatus Omnitrophota bacterium]